VLSDTELLIWSHVLQTAVVQMLEKQMGPEPFRKVYVWSTLCLIGGCRHMFVGEPLLFAALFCFSKFQFLC
jgi:hypothetical protein